MPKISECDRCSFFSRTHFIVCAVHPSGPDHDRCHDFETAELWEPEDPAAYTEQNMEDWLWHPLFTGKCPECRHPFSRYKLPPLHWHCHMCGWDEEDYE